MIICGGFCGNGGIISVITLRGGYSFTVPELTVITLRSTLGIAGGSSRIIRGGGGSGLSIFLRNIT